MSGLPIAERSALWKAGGLEGAIKQLDSRGLEGVDVTKFDLLGLKTLDILSETHGYPIYQEQLMQIAEAMCGFTPGEADDLRSALAGKDVDAMRRFHRKWADGAAVNGFDAEVAQRAWDDFEAFAKHLFLKAHATAYAVFAMRTAYMNHLKTVIYCTLAAQQME